MSSGSIIWAKTRENEWQCTECGHVETQSTRPGYCPHCNCVNSDTDPGLWLFIRRKSCGWFE